MKSFRGLLAYMLVVFQASFLIACDERYVKSSSSNRDVLTVRDELGRILGTIESDGTMRNDVGRIIGTIE